MQQPWLYPHRFLFQPLSRDEGDRYLNLLLQQEFLTMSNVALASVNEEWRGVSTYRATKECPEHSKAFFEQQDLRGL